jgi:hypothetical protein
MESVVMLLSPSQVSRSTAGIIPHRHPGYQRHRHGKGRTEAGTLATIMPSDGRIDASRHRHRKSPVNPKRNLPFCADGTPFFRE